MKELIIETDLDTNTTQDGKINMALVVPRSSQQVQDSGIPNARVNDEAPLSAYGSGKEAQQLSSTRDALLTQEQKVFQEEKKKADDIVFADADLEASQSQTEIEVRVKQMLGKDAGQASEYAETEWRKADERINKRFTDDDQRARYSRASKTRYNSIFKVVQEHQSSEFRKYEQEQTTAYVEAAREEAIENYQDPERIELSLERQNAAITKILSNRGIELSSPAGQKIYNTARSKTHEGVINRMLADENDVMAEEYFKQHKDQIEPDDATALTKNLEEGSRRGRSQRLSDSILSKTESLSDALTEAYKITDEGDREMVLDKIQAHHQLNKLAEAEKEKQRLESAISIVDKDPRREAVPPEMWNAMDNQAQKAVIERINIRRGGGTIETDRAVYYDLLGMAQDNKKKFRDVDLMKYSNSLSDTDFKKLADAQKEDKAGKSAQLDGFLSDKAVADEVLSDIGIDPKKNKKNKELALEFYSALDSRVLQFTKDNERKPNNDELRKLANPLIIKLRDKDSGFLGFGQNEKFAFQGKINNTDEIVVPDEFRARIIDKAKRENKKLNDAQIRSIYALYMTKHAKGKSGSR